MFSHVKWLSCVLMIGVISTATADEVEVKKDLITAVKDVAEQPEAFNKAIGAVLQKVNEQMQSDPDQAEALLQDLEDAIDGLSPENADSKKLIDRVPPAVTFYRQQIELARVQVADLQKKLDASPDDVATLSQLQSKYQQGISAIARSEPEEAEKQLKEAKEFLAALKEKSTEALTKSRIERAVNALDRYQSTIDSAKKLLALIGQEAAPLEIEAWVNGSPLTAGDLKGKVVLLDFWAVWCGPCIATFPHLRDWQERYGEKGLRIIGLTRYYNYQWDEEAGRANRSQEKVSAEDEQKMLVKFAESHDLQHRFAIMADNSLTEYYAVSGIPHVVVIDDSGIVRMMKVGSGEANAQAIDELLHQLLGQNE